ncbi:TPA: hypothetical protein N0F65_010461 [Lagenidium giganteum]|uniref:Uncharacterized protein n=1 Tax=Lagenidium giganteum TaxID=4803 RepID=A0AAV2YL07_9STRA|nr:TPA: hypothetical protein N0F65_010461 [Lagenidium giganteum]
MKKCTCSNPKRAERCRDRCNLCGRPLVDRKNQRRHNSDESRIARSFQAKDMGPISFILCLKIVRHRPTRQMWINQELNAQNIIAKFNVKHSHPAATPTAAGKKLYKSTQVMRWLN